MHSMSDRSTEAPLLESWRDRETEVRIAIERWCAQVPVANQFIVRPRSLRMVWNYLRRIGPLAVARKIRSRTTESRRNVKIAGIGVGAVVEAPAGSSLRSGESVAFFAPNHSGVSERICVDARLVVAVGADASVNCETARTVLDTLAPLIGWSRFSGIPLDAAAVPAALLTLKSEKGDVSTRGGSSLEPTFGRHWTDRVVAAVPPLDRPTAVVFGLGNYAKTQILPGMRNHLTLAAIHEIDPDQVAEAARFGATLDTNPLPREGEHYNAWFIAGYHHTHAPLAVRALDEGAYAVVEKPLVTTRQQLDALTSALKRAERSRLFGCFHKRYSELNEWARADLGTEPGEAVDMHCIVYEIPLPARHWYNWPTSGSRIISNGCHWLDYFLYMNDYAPVADAIVRPMRGRDLAVVATLENGAQLVMSLTDCGSERLGVRDVIELRARDVTVRLIDSTSYESENTRRVLRRRSVNPTRAYARMYHSICRRIVAREPADAPASMRSTRFMLDLEDEIRAVRRHSVATAAPRPARPASAYVRSADPSA